VVDEMSSWSVAAKLIKAGMRPPVVHAATGLPLKKLRRMYQQYNGESPTKGRVQEAAYRCLHKAWQALEATAYLLVYRNTGGARIWQVLDTNLVLEAFRIYEGIASPRFIDVTKAWYLARDLRERTVEFRRCQRCGKEYLYDQRSAIIQRCLRCR